MARNVKQQKKFSFRLSSVNTCIHVCALFAHVGMIHEMRLVVYSSFIKYVSTSVTIFSMQMQNRKATHECNNIFHANAESKGYVYSVERAMLFVFCFTI